MYRATYHIMRSDFEGGQHIQESGFTNATSVVVEENMIQVFFENSAGFLLIPIHSIVGEIDVEYFEE